MATVAEQMVKTLVEAGVKRIYGIVGDSLNGIMMRSVVKDRFNGSMFATRKWQRSPRVPTRM